MAADDVVDEFYFSALHDHEVQFPITDEGYAEELQLQEVLIISSSWLSPSSRPLLPPKTSPEEDINRCGDSGVAAASFSRNLLPSSSSSSCTDNNSAFEFDYKMKGTSTSSTTNIVGGSSSSSLSCKSRLGFCPICMENKPIWELFFLDKCSHSFCLDCISKYLATKIQEGAMMEILCPDVNCRECMDPGSWKTLVPKEVFQRWENAQFELMILGSKKYYCPFKDCSALMENDMENVVGSVECPICHRLFCVQCKVGWHQGLNCEEYQRVGNDDNAKNDLLAMKLVKDRQWMKCPRCSYYVEKESGCQHITCRCQYEFCYACGSKWSTIHHCLPTGTFK